ncbi:MAG: FHA domain-containing protein [Lachnospiraceae bacterium]|nr:FHA domain-containing protein [Lachnospiraceae bacterium]
MIETEFIKSMNLNFERIKLDEKPEERRYQYCILSRGGIRGLLECSLRYINSDAFLYYNISSKQNLSQIMNKKKVDRQWLKDFAWNLNYVRQEINRFLLDDANIIWEPEKIYRDLDENRWSFIYYPYYNGDNGFSRFLEFMIEKLDYDDDKLVECAYRIYENYENFGDTYLREKIYEDIKWLDNKRNRKKEKVNDSNIENVSDTEDETEEPGDEIESVFADSQNDEKTTEISGKTESDDEEAIQKEKEPKHGLLAFLEGARKKDKEARAKAKKENRYAMNYRETLEVAEGDEDYGEDKTDNDKQYGKTVYIEKVAEAKDIKKRLFGENGEVKAILGEEPLVIGKKEDECDLVLEDDSVSRLHARIVPEGGGYMLEDLNSTNGTFKNGIRLKPYERRKLVSGDEIRAGSVIIIYK